MRIHVSAGAKGTSREHFSTVSWKLVPWRDAQGQARLELHLPYEKREAFPTVVTILSRLREFNQRRKIFDGSPAKHCAASAVRSLTLLRQDCAKCHRGELGFNATYKAHDSGAGEGVQRFKVGTCFL